MKKILELWGPYEFGRELSFPSYANRLSIHVGSSKYRLYRYIVHVSNRGLLFYETSNKSQSTSFSGVHHIWETVNCRFNRNELTKMTCYCINLGKWGSGDFLALESAFLEETCLHIDLNLQ